MSNKLLLTVASAAAVVAMSMTAVAAPLPANAKLGITLGVGSLPNLACSAGSCFGMEVAPGFVVWTDYGPGTDGGFVVGKNQTSGGQETGPSSANTTAGQLTSAWLFFGNMGTFYTLPGGDSNVFDDAGCAGAACSGRTALNVFNVAWNGGVFPMGSAAGCSHPNCTPDQLAGIFIRNYIVNNTVGGAWGINFNQVIPSGQFLGVRFSLIARGEVTPSLPCNCPPTAASVSLTTGVNILSPWMPSVSDYDGNPVSCRIGTPPANGVATVQSNCASGTYQSSPGFIGVDTFTYIPNNGIWDGAPAVVSVAVAELMPTPTATYTPTLIPSLTTSPTFTATSTAIATVTPTPTPMDCAGKYPVTQFSQTGKEGSLSITFTGNITSHTNKVVKICPGTSLSYVASSTTDMVKCKARSNTTSGAGTLRIKDHLKCTDKPKGKDKLHFKVKSGVAK